ncbi:MAG TPA: hypothetical protein VGB89_14805 [Bacteroidota bacterium]
MVIGGFSGTVKKVFILLFIVGIGVGIWFAFALWTGLYSVYSFPPGKEHKDGVTLIVNRESGEPLFNSPDYVEPPKPPPAERTGLGFGNIPMPKKPLSIRTIVELPYIEWAYKKSLPEKEDKGKKKPI